jgi:6-phosphogluconolactonase
MESRGFVVASDPRNTVIGFSVEHRTGKCRIVSETPSWPEAMHLSVSPGRDYLYAAAAAEGVAPDSTQRRGRARAYRIEQDPLSLTYLNEQATDGSTTCYVSVSPDGGSVLAANFREYGQINGPGARSRGNVVVFPVRSDGGLGKASDVRRHEGTSLHPVRQTDSHPHCVRVHPDGRHVFVTDLGVDRIFVYRLDPRTHRIEPTESGSVACAQPSGPRHLAVHPNGKYVYAITEIASTIIGLLFDPGAGSLSTIQTVSTVPVGCDGPNACADVHVHPSGRFLYGSNRGHGSLVRYAVDPETGMMEGCSITGIPDCVPSGFEVTREGDLLLLPSSRGLLVYALDGSDGSLSPVKTSIHVPCTGAICLM